jgi:hypothetical protein
MPLNMDEITTETFRIGRMRGTPERVMTLGPKSDTPQKREKRIDKRKFPGEWVLSGICPTSGPLTCLIFTNVKRTENK